MPKQKKAQNLIALELIIYAAIPFIIWKFGRGSLGDYPALLISTIPGIVYTIYRFFVDRQFNIAGLFILSSMALGTTVSLLSGSAEKMLWNGVYLSLFYTGIHFVSLMIRRPLALYFAVDFVYLQGHAREGSKWLFYQKGIFKWFQMIQAVFVFRGLFMAGLNGFLLQKYGVDGYDQMLIYRQVAGWFFWGLVTWLFFYTSVPIKKFLADWEKTDSDSSDPKLGEELQI